MERAVFRIIDANFNRAREAARVMEEYCRFVLNSSALSGRAKQLRHQICGAIGKLDANKLIAARDVCGDVGRGMRVDGQLGRANLRDCFAAAAKRLTEALRVLAETAQTLNPAVAQTFEQLRFNAYSLEKDILISSSVAEKLSSVRLYVLLNANDDSSGSEILDLANACAAGGADCIQLRAKGINDRHIFKLAGEIVKVCKDATVVSIINDRVDIAAAVGADGVHLGQEDLPVSQARRMQLAPMIFGLSTHSIDQLKAAIAEKPDYVSLGAVFAGSTKPHVATAGLEYVSEATQLLQDSGIGHVAIGGITLENIDQVLKAGADAVAVCSAVAQARDPKTMCRRLKDKILATKT